MDAVFLTLGDVLEMHTDQIERYGGEIGIRDKSLLESALAMPMAGLGGELFHPSLYDKAAAYLFHIVQNHPFIDGNKRTGALAAFVFLDLNGTELNCTDDQLEEMVLEVAKGQMDKAKIAEFLKKHC
ncbi:MAG: type II toxin-antitoxin system death-on-curing family toxin [Planctomycetota bacterium]|nr:type II toxin-antitoxin system death-on-curing family toxin [Planctomycetota bacterium]